MFTNDLDIRADEPFVAESERPPTPISFLCPLCDERLCVPSELAGTVAPCPSCSEMIRAPRARAVESPIRRQTDVSTSEILVSAPDQRISNRSVLNPGFGNQGWGETTERPESPPKVDFSGVKKIEAPEELDESWVDRARQGRKQMHRRKRVQRLTSSLFESKRAEKVRAIGIGVIGVVLVITICALYLNNRSGGKLFSRLFGL